MSVEDWGEGRRLVAGREGGYEGMTVVKVQDILERTCLYETYHCVQ